MLTLREVADTAGRCPIPEIPVYCGLRCSAQITWGLTSGVLCRQPGATQTRARHQTSQELGFLAHKMAGPGGPRENAHRRTCATKPLTRSGHSAHSFILLRLVETNEWVQHVVPETLQSVTKFSAIYREIRNGRTKMFKYCLFFKKMVIIDHILCFEYMVDVFNWKHLKSCWISIIFHFLFYFVMKSKHWTEHRRIFRHLRKLIFILVRNLNFFLRKRKIRVHLI